MYNRVVFFGHVSLNKTKVCTFYKVYHRKWWPKKRLISYITYIECNYDWNSTFLVHYSFGRRAKHVDSIFEIYVQCQIHILLSSWSLPINCGHKDYSWLQECKVIFHQNGWNCFISTYCFSYNYTLENIILFKRCITLLTSILFTFLVLKGMCPMPMVYIYCI